MIVRIDGETISSRTEIANTFLKRFCGLMGRKNIPPDGGMFFYNCGSIHCFFMRFTIDVVYISRDMTVVGVETIKPWRVGRLFKGAKNVLELPEGKASGVKNGMKVEITEK